MINAFCTVYNKNCIYVSTKSSDVERELKETTEMSLYAHKNKVFMYKIGLSSISPVASLAKPDKPTGRLLFIRIDKELYSNRSLKV